MLGDAISTVNGRIDFERALVRDLTLRDGSTVRAFRGLTVYPERLAGDGAMRSAYVVCGSLIGRGRLNGQSGEVEAKVEQTEKSKPRKPASTTRAAANTATGTTAKPTQAGGSGSDTVSQSGSGK